MAARIFAALLICFGATRPATAADWTVDAGAGAISASRSIGSGRQLTFPVPVIEARYRDWFFATDNPIEGVGVATKLPFGLRLSLGVGVDLDTRDPHEDPHVQGLSKVSAAAALRVRAEYETENWFSSLTLLDRLASSNAGGRTLSTEAGYHAVATERFLVSIGADARIVDNCWARTFLTVSPLQAQSSGLADFHARAGLVDGGGFVQSLYRIDDRWTLFTRAGYSRFSGANDASPVLSHRGDVLGLLFITRIF